MAVFVFPQIIDRFQSIFSIHLFGDRPQNFNTEFFIVDTVCIIKPFYKIVFSGQRFELNVRISLQRFVKRFAISGTGTAAVIFVGNQCSHLIVCLHQAGDITVFGCSQRFRTRAFHKPVMVKPGKLYELIVEHVLKSFVMVHVRVADHGDKRKRQRIFLVIQIKPPGKVSVHVVGFAGIYNNMLIIGGNDVASVALTNIHKVDFQYTLFLYVSHFYPSVTVTAFGFHPSV